jgi:ATP-dependent RNA helicase DeaD
MRKNIEYAIRGRIQVDKLPGVADLRARRLAQTRERLREALMAEDLESGRIVVESLVNEFSLMDVALAAVKLATEALAGAGEEGEEIPDAFRSVQADSRGRASSASGRGGAKGAAASGKRKGRAGTVNIYLGVGRSAGIRPQDIVGAIANEAGLQGRDIGAIEINDSYSLVEIPEAAADNVVAALRQTFIKGKKATVRREREDR